MMDDVGIQIKDGQAYFNQGVLYGGGGPERIVQQKDDLLLIKIKGHKAWTDQMHPFHYEPIKYVLFRIKKKVFHGVVLCEEIFQFGVR